MKRSYLIGSIIAVLALVFLGLKIAKLRNASDVPAVDPLEELRALPYVQWTARDADPLKKSVTLHDPLRAFQGYNLISNLVDEIYLLDMNGRTLHTWRIPKKLLIDDAYLMPDGSLVVSAVSDFLKVSWDSRVLWRTAIQSHHEITLLPNGNFMTLVLDSHKYKSHNMNFDGISVVSSSGKLLFTWKAFEHLDEIRKLHHPSPLEIYAARDIPGGYDYYHMNTIKTLPATELGKTDKRFQEGNLLTCFRNVNLIAILDKDSWKIVWHWGTKDLDWPHAPTMLENGRILIFDNGIHRGYTRVLEVDPATNKVVWSYEGTPPKNFYSDFRGVAQRLPNGNTLICEAGKGRIFEIDPDNVRVWEYWNPDIRKGKRQGVSFFHRLPPGIMDTLPAR